MNTHSQHSILEVKDLSIGYGKTVVIDGVSFESQSGELTGIVGANGIGKSTLLRTLGNLQASLSGSISIAEKSINNINPIDFASKVSVVLTEPIASKNLTVQELIALGRQPYTNWIGTLTENDIRKISEALHMVELHDLRDSKCYELSDGQLQRVMVARALAQDTPLILLDEPTTHLDLYHKVQTLKLLNVITKKTKKAILFTSHEIEMVLQLCDKIILLKETGSTFGTPDQLIAAGEFDNLFPANTISFDANTRTFGIQK